LDGTKVLSFNDPATLGKTYFHALFEENGNNNFREIMRVLRLFPRLFDEDVNDSMDMEVTKE
jgi:hypothetical protein